MCRPGRHPEPEFKVVASRRVSGSFREERSHLPDDCAT